MEESDTLLSKILVLVQEIHQSLDDQNVRLSALENSMKSVVVDAFVDGDMKRHKEWHSENELPKWRKWILRLVG